MKRTTFCYAPHTIYHCHTLWHSHQEMMPNARLIWTTPSHQLPTGVTMSLPRRMNLLEWASHADAWILEDDYDSEYRWSGFHSEVFGMEQGKWERSC